MKVKLSEIVNIKEILPQYYTYYHNGEWSYVATLFASIDSYSSTIFCVDMQTKCIYVVKERYYFELEFDLKERWTITFDHKKGFFSRIKNIKNIGKGFYEVEGCGEMVYNIEDKKLYSAEEWLMKDIIK